MPAGLFFFLLLLHCQFGGLLGGDDMKEHKSLLDTPPELLTKLQEKCLKTNDFLLKTYLAAWKLLKAA